jgi:hypothetical protein
LVELMREVAAFGGAAAEGLGLAGYVHVCDYRVGWIKSSCSGGGPQGRGPARPGTAPGSTTTYPRLTWMRWTHSSPVLVYELRFLMDIVSADSLNYSLVVPGSCFCFKF